MNKYIAILLVAFSGSAFADLTTFICNYPIYSDQKGSHDSGEKFELVFIIDSTEKKAYMKGNNGTDEVTVLTGDDLVAFVQVTDSGNVMTTAIVKNMDSVHSRNSVIFGQIVPSQYYGKCEKK